MLSLHAYIYKGIDTYHHIHQVQENHFLHEMDRLEEHPEYSNRKLAVVLSTH